ncbi:MAG TPA: hypothetical protein PKY59_04025 [Pyrinomonadaceae bacterium]|nr:hypothetical protein [Pyrinomonadaceae bacterium]
MNLPEIVKFAVNKENYTKLEFYIEFTKVFLNVIPEHLQAVIVSQNENHYRFFQFNEDGYFNISRPINSNLFYNFDEINKITVEFPKILSSIQQITPEDLHAREILIKSIYTIQQTIGIALDALPAGASNQARKVNGDLFERLIQILLNKIGINCQTGTVKVPVYVDNELQFNMSYQHDLLIMDGEQLKAIGSVKTSSKDRIDKIFMDKFLYSKLTETSLPHIAIFLNDVQRKQTKKENIYGINSTFLTGHFKAFTVKLNPLDGVYYCDIRPNMERDDLLKKHIRTIDHLFFEDIWNLLKS